MTALLNRLADEELALRSADASDGRAARVSITSLRREAGVCVSTLPDGGVGTPALAALDESHRALLLAAAPAIDRLVDWPAEARQNPTTRRTVSTGRPMGETSDPVTTLP